jgi:hypothetical protein
MKYSVSNTVLAQGQPLVVLYILFVWNNWLYCDRIKEMKKMKKM